MQGTITSIIRNYKDALEVGESIRVNHEDCTAGEDTKRRLYVTRKADVLLGYCHNCSKSSSMYMSKSDRYRDVSVRGIRRPAEDYIDPELVGFNDKENIPAEADAWRIKNKLSRKDCAAFTISYCPDWDAIYLPFFNMDGDRSGHQLRPLHKRGGAKYINFQKDKDTELGGIVFSTHPTSNSCLVIVEDLVSGIHIANAGYNALVNYGTHVKPSILHSISNHYTSIVVWLDNDNAVVHRHAKDIENILHLYNQTGLCIRRISKYEDPKHYDTEKIREIVNNGRS